MRGRLHHEQRVVVITQVVVLVFIVRLFHQADGFPYPFVAALLVLLVVEHLSHVEQGDGLHLHASALFRLFQQQLDVTGFLRLVVQAVVAGNHAVHLLHVLPVITAYRIALQRPAVEFQRLQVMPRIEVKVTLGHVHTEPGKTVPPAQFRHNLRCLVEIRKRCIHIHGLPLSGCPAGVCPYQGHASRSPQWRMFRQGRRLPPASIQLYGKGCSCYLFLFFYNRAYMEQETATLGINAMKSCPVYYYPLQSYRIILYNRRVLQTFRC